ncbi:MAG: hypothetical protein MJ010_07645 [Paludibacteraceae bacterium]|nr:hypothetical protein [Paludibacteraceae bacterium]
MNNFFYRVLRRTRDSKFIKHSKILTGSATFALLLSIIFFVYQTIDSRRESEKIINNLVNVQNSITTKYIGIFPIYIPRINNLLEEALDSYTKDYTNKVDTVIIFQDFLCYGIKSDPAGFAQMTELLLHLSDLGCQIYIAYYKPTGRAFNTLIKETFLSTENYAKYQNDRHRYFELRTRLYDDFTRQLRNKKNECNNTLPPHFVDSLKKALFHQYFEDLFDMNKLKSLGVSEHNIVAADSGTKITLTKHRDDVYLMDSLKSEEYFTLTKSEDEASFKKLLASYMDTIPQMQHSSNVASWTIRTNNMIQHMNGIKRNNLNKNYKDVSYFDFYNTYMEFSREMERMYSMCNPENMHLIPLDDYLTMSCWMTSCEGKGKAIFAFPSKYATEEIGFESQDDAISDYIRTMLNGVLVSSVEN